MMSDKIVTPVDGDLGELLNRTFTSSFRTGYVKVDGFVMADSYEKFSQTIEDFKIRDDDVWLCGFPKSGTTWTQEMVWCIANDLDFDGAKVSVDQRFPLFEFPCVLDPEETMQRNPSVDIPEHMADSFSYVERAASPRFIKTHLPFNLLPRELRTGEKKPKIVYVVRDAKDTCISFFHFMKYVSGFKGNFDDFCTLFVGDTVICGPYWDHVSSFWKKREEDNVLIVKYEDMLKDLSFEIKRTAGFFGKSLSDNEVAVLAKHLNFDNMKKNPAANNEKFVSNAKKISQVKHEGAFLRCGKSGQWRTAMTTDVIKQFDDWAERNMKDTDFPYHSQLPDERPCPKSSFHCTLDSR